MPAKPKGVRPQAAEAGGGSLLPVWREGPANLARFGKAYNVHDAFLNLNLGRHLQKLGVLALPIDFIPVAGNPLRDWESRPVWRYNQEIIRASLWCAGKSSFFRFSFRISGAGPTP